MLHARLPEFSDVPSKLDPAVVALFRVRRLIGCSNFQVRGLESAIAKSLIMWCPSYFLFAVPDSCK